MNDRNAKPIIGINATCPVPGCSSVIELHGPSDAAEVHTTSPIDDQEGRFRVGAMLVDDGRWSVTAEVPYVLTAEQALRLSTAIIRVAHEASRLNIARDLAGNGVNE